MATEGKDFSAEEAETAGELLGELSQLQEQLLGRGAFRRFVEVRAGQGSEVQLACGSPSFTTAAGSIVRQVRRRGRKPQALRTRFVTPDAPLSEVQRSTRRGLVRKRDTDKDRTFEGRGFASAAYRRVAGVDGVEVVQAGACGCDKQSRHWRGALGGQ